MKTNLWVSLTLLAVIICIGVGANLLTDRLSARYVSAAEELLILTEDGQWQRADETADAYREQWEHVSVWLRMIVVHEDIDAVALSLRRVQAGIRARDASLCFEGCGELRDYAERIADRSGLTMGNIL